MTERFMRLALRDARKGMRRLEGGPFGACVVKNGRVIAVAHNTVLRDKDATAHAEVNAIRLASRKLKRYVLDDCEIYSTTEPCPMCFSAIHWARIKKIHFGTSIRDVWRLGFNEMPIKDTELKRLGKSSIKIKSGFLRGECLKLLREWESLGGRRVY